MNTEIIYKPKYKYHCTNCKQQFKRMKNRDAHELKCTTNFKTKLNHRESTNLNLQFRKNTAYIKANTIKKSINQLFNGNNIELYNSDELFLVNYFSNFNINSFMLTQLQRKRMYIEYDYLVDIDKAPKINKRTVRNISIIMLSLLNHTKEIIISKTSK